MHIGTLRLCVKYKIMAISSLIWEAYGKLERTWHVELEKRMFKFYLQGLQAATWKGNHS